MFYLYGNLTCFSICFKCTEKAVYMHISHEINCKINAISKRTPLLGQDETLGLI